MATFNEIRQAAHDLTQGADSPSIRLALCAGILSANNRLDRNGWQVQAMRVYMRQTGGKLPTSTEHIKHLTRRAGYECSIGQARSIVALETSFQRGELSELARMPSNGHEWLLWRQAIARMPGLGYKTASFAALLLWPHESPLVPIDRHVLGWTYSLGLLQAISGNIAQITKRVYRSRPLGYRTYRAIERQIGNAKLHSPYADDATALYHWYQWENWRQELGVSKTAHGEPESHALLSPYYL